MKEAKGANMNLNNNGLVMVEQDSVLPGVCLMKQHEGYEPFPHLFS